MSRNYMRCCHSSTVYPIACSHQGRHPLGGIVNFIISRQSSTGLWLDTCYLVAYDDPDDLRVFRALSSISFVANWMDVGFDVIEMS